MKPFLSLIRWPNLLMIAYMQYVMRYAVIQPIIKLYGFELQMSGFTFFCLVLSTICTAAAGYVINDYFDIKTDHINRPDKVIVGKYISRRKTMMIHLILSIAGVLLGGYVTWAVGVPLLVLLFIFITGMLWLYSTTYKRQFLIGNLVVSLFTAIVPLLTLLDIPLLNRVYYNELLDMQTNLNLVVVWVSGFACMAFLTTFSREVIKDTEDFEGDSVCRTRSVPIVLGIGWAKGIVITVNMLTAGILGFVFWRFLRHNFEGGFDFLSFVYFLLLILSLLWVNWQVYRAHVAKDYHQASVMMKIIMVAGITYGWVVWYMMC